MSNNEGDSARSRTTFMFGFERSGTTLLSMMMGAHPLLAVPLTVTGLWYTYAQRLDNYGGLKTRADVEALVRDLLKEERILLWDEDIEFNDVLEQLEENSYSAVIRAFNQVYANKKNKPHWANLDIATIDNMELAYGWFPDVRFIHIVRDGRDVALSHETMPYGASNTLDCAQSWERRLTISMKMGRMLPASQYKIVRFEDLVIEPETTLIGLCNFIGIEYSPRMLEYTTMVDQKIPDDRRWLWPALDKAPQPQKCYGWKERMDAKRRIVFEGEAGFLLERLGYETYTQLPKKISAYAFQLWCFLGRAGRMRRLAKAMGFQRKSRLEREWKENSGK